MPTLTTWRRALEAEFVAAQSDHTPGKDWERVAHYIDFTSKGNRNQRDTSKFKSTLLLVRCIALYGAGDIKD